jgi:hypothetical protein
VIPRAAGPVRRLGLQQLSVDQTRNNELHQTVGQPGVRGEHPHHEPIVRSRSLVGDACDDLDEVTVAEHR